MRTIVSKFGGSSTASAAQFKRILALVRASPARRCVVLSAPGTDAAHGEKVTALLEACWRYREQSELLEWAVSRIADRFSEISVGLSMPDMGGLARREVLEAVQISLPHTLSRGEYLCALLFSRYSDIPMADAAGLVAFDEIGDLDDAQTQRNFEALGDHVDSIVLPGFYGADPAGRIRTFPRNGSDISGALAAAGLGAGLYENWTDVPGLMTADPAIVPDARLIPQVSYRQMRALARAGAQVLHPACLDPVALAGIHTRLRCTNRPSCFGTLIDEHVARDAPCIAGRQEDSSATITVFGIPEPRVREAAALLRPLSVEGYPGRVRVKVESENYGDSVRYLHRALIE